MQVDYNTSLKILNNSGKLQVFLELFQSFLKDECKQQLFDAVLFTKTEQYDVKEITVDTINAIMKNQAEITIKAKGPYSGFSCADQDQICLFKELAEAFPETEFIGTVIGGTSYTEEELKYYFKQGQLFSTFYWNNWNEHETYVVFNIYDPKEKRNVFHKSAPVKKGKLDVYLPPEHDDFLMGLTGIEI